MAISPTDPHEVSANSDHLPGSGEFSAPPNVSHHDPAYADDADVADEAATGDHDGSAVTSESEGPIPNQSAVSGDALNSTEDGVAGVS